MRLCYAVGIDTQHVFSVIVSPLKNEAISKQMDPEFKKRWIEELERLKENERRGFVVGVKISKPKPWPPAAEMVQLYEAGMGTKTIAKKTGYSLPTVERNLKTRGEDPRTGPQCDKYSGKVFSVDEALKEMPLPCGPKCICDWRPILRSDRETR